MTDASSYPASFDADTWFLPAKNNIRTELITTVLVTQNNSINVSTTADFPEEGIISIDEEVIYYKSKTPSSFRNLVRGFDGTIAAQHINGAEVELRWVAGHHNRSKNAIRAVERVLGINPQGVWPDLRSRLDAAANTVFRRTDQKLLKVDGVTEVDAGYNPGSHLARTFKMKDEFIVLGEGADPAFDYLGPEVHLDGLRQERNPTVYLSKNHPVSAIDVDNAGFGVVTISSGSFIADGVQPGDLLVVKGTANNDDAYVVQSIDSAVQITVTELIFGTDSAGVGSVDVISTSDVTHPFKDYVAAQMLSTDSDVSDGIIFLNPPETIQYIRADYFIKNDQLTVTYTNPVAAQASYTSPLKTGNIAASSNEQFTLSIGKPRAIAFRVRLVADSSPEPTNVKIEIFGKSDYTEREYMAEYIDLSLGEFVDNGVWHFMNIDNPVLENMYCRITNADAINALDYTFELEVEALGDYA